MTFCCVKVRQDGSCPVHGITSNNPKETWSYATSDYWEARSRFRDEVVKILQDCIEENKKMDDRSQREYLTLYPIQEAIEKIKNLSP
jgi:hypothetical protein